MKKARICSILKCIYPIIDWAIFSHFINSSACKKKLTKPTKKTYAHINEISQLPLGVKTILINIFSSCACTSVYQWFVTFMITSLHALHVLERSKWVSNGKLNSVFNELKMEGSLSYAYPNRWVYNTFIRSIWLGVVSVFVCCFHNNHHSFIPFSMHVSLYSGATFRFCSFVCLLIPTQPPDIV